MAALYRKEVLGEKAPEGGFVAIGGIKPAPAVAKEEETVAGD